MIALLTIERGNKMKPIQISLVYEKSTKGTHVFVDRSDTAVVPTLYVRKQAFAGAEPPKVITVVIDDVSKPVFVAKD